MSVKTDKKINWTNFIRRALQILSFVLMPGLFISTFSSIKSVYTAIIAGTFSVITLMPQILILIAIIPITIIVGRVFCGFLCSFGALGDLMWFISKKTMKKKLKVSPKADKVMKALKYVLLVFLIVFVWTLGAVSIDPNANPWNIFGMYSSLSAWSSLAGFATFGGLLLILILVGSYFIERFFCRYLCPLGAVFTIISKFRIVKIKKPSNACKSCKVCTNNCSMGIEMYKDDVIKSGECIDCFQCIAPCPRDNAKVSVAGKIAIPIVVGVVTSLAIALLYFAAVAKLNSAHASPQMVNVESAETYLPDQTSEQSQQLGLYIDGTFTGKARGYRGNTKVSVIVENGYIISVDIVSTDDDMEFFNTAQIPVITDIINTQSTQVDAVSGATYSSDAIMNAVADAIVLNDAVSIQETDAPAISNEVADTTTTPETQTETPVPTQTQELQVEIPAELNDAVAYLDDGVYTGVGSGFRGDTQVEVTVQSGAIVNIELVDYEDDRPYMDRAIDLVDDIVTEQSVDVDTISGATYSSNSILEAVANALDLDFTNTNGESGRGHGGRGGGH